MKYPGGNSGTESGFPLSQSHILKTEAMSLVANFLSLPGCMGVKFHGTVIFIDVSENCRIIYMYDTVSLSMCVLPVLWYFLFAVILKKYLFVFSGSHKAPVSFVISFSLSVCLSPHVSTGFTLDGHQ